MKPKLLVVTSTFPRWLNDTDPPFVYELSKRLTANFDVTVHTPHYHGSLACEMIDGMRIHRFRYCFSCFETLAGGQGIVPKLRRNNLYYALLPFFLSAQFFSLVSLVRTVKPDVIHAHWLIPQGFFAVMLKRLFGLPVIVTAHGADVFSLRQTVFIWLKKYIVNKADSIVTVSGSLAKMVVVDTQSVKQPKIISMGVDAELFSPQKKNRNIREQYNICGPFLLFVGRLTEKKGVRHLIDSMPMVVSEHPYTKLLIVGHGELEEELKKRVEQLGLQKVVCFTGGLPNKELPPYYASADIFIAPSVRAKGGDTEGFGLTLVEAAMSGCLLIGTKTGGIEDIICEGRTGFLIPPEDAGHLAETILYAINNFSNLEQMKTRGRVNALRRFEWGGVVTQYVGAIQAITAKKLNP